MKINYPFVHLPPQYQKMVELSFKRKILRYQDQDLDKKWYRSVVKVFFSTQTLYSSTKNKGLLFNFFC